MMVDLYNYSLLTIFLTSFAVVWAVTELGWQLAVRGDGRGAPIFPRSKPPHSDFWL